MSDEHASSQPIQMRPVAERDAALRKHYGDDGPGVFTASWGVALGADQAVPVRISLGSPDAAKDGPWIGALIPFGIFGKGLSWPDFCAAYRQRLNGYGIDGIRTRIASVARAHPGRPLLLCCFEKDRAECHRGLLSEWWEKQTGEPIPEWAADLAQKSNLAQKSHMGYGQLRLGTDR